MEAGPRLRGLLHLITAPIAGVGGITLSVLAETTAERVGLIVFTITSVLLFAVSAAYHRGSWSQRVEQRLRRLDHSNIFLIIAGTYTPLTIALLNATSARNLLTAIWTAALLGVVTHNVWPTAPRFVSAGLYVLMGWLAVFYLQDFRSAGWTILGLLIAGGVLYTIGAVIYATERPRLSVTWFGYHELFHAFTVLGFASHFAAIAISTA